MIRQTILPKIRFVIKPTPRVVLLSTWALAMTVASQARAACTGSSPTWNSTPDQNYCSPISATCLEAQVHNAFIFNNVAGGTEESPTYTEADGGACGSDPPWGDNSYIVLNREYWMPSYGKEANLPSTCTADGNTYYGTTDTDKIYKCTSANKWTLFFKPYPYPHPLRTGSSGPQDAGTGGTGAGGASAGSGGTGGASAGGFATGGGSALDGGAGKDAGPALTSASKSGCSCRTVGEPTGSSAAWLLLLAGAALVEARRPRRIGSRDE